MKNIIITIILSVSLSGAALELLGQTNGPKADPPKRRVHYRIIARNNTVDLAHDVDRALNDGWELYGNLAVAVSEAENRSQTGIYAQTLIRSETLEAEEGK